MRRMPEPRAHDDTRDTRLIEHPPTGNRGNRHTVLLRHGVHDSQQLLKERPSPRGANEAPVLHLRPRFERIPVGLGRAQPLLAEKTAQHGAVAEQSHPMLARVRRELGGEAGVDQAAADLVAHDLDAAGDRDAQMGGVEVGHADGTQSPGITLALQQPECIEPARIGEGPCVELQQIDRLHLQPLTGAIDGVTHVARRHGARRRNPLGETLHGGVAGRLAVSKDAGDELGGPVMIGHIERRQPGGDIRRH